MNQISVIKQIENKFELKLERDLGSLKSNNEEKANFPFNLNFLQDLHSTKKMGVIIDISNNSIFKQNSRAASSVAQYLASLLASNGENVLCLVEQESKQNVTLAGQAKQNNELNTMLKKEGGGL